MAVMEDHSIYDPRKGVYMKNEDHPLFQFFLRFLRENQESIRITNLDISLEVTDSIRNLTDITKLLWRAFLAGAAIERKSSEKQVEIEDKTKYSV